MRVQARESSATRRCALCHGPFTADAWTCRRCRTQLHGDCLAALGRCPTLGCGQAPVRRPTPVVVAPPRRRRGWMPWMPRTWVSLIALTALGYLVAPALEEKLVRRFADADDGRPQSATLLPRGHTIVDRRTGAVVRDLGSRRAVSVSPTNEVAVALADSPEHLALPVLVTLATGQVTPCETADEVDALEWSPDGSRLLGRVWRTSPPLRTRSVELGAWDAHTGARRVRHRLDLGLDYARIWFDGRQATLLSLSQPAPSPFAADGPSVAEASQIDVATSETLDRASVNVDALSSNSTDSYLVAVSAHHFAVGTAYGPIRVYSIARGSLVREIEGGRGPVRFSTGGHYLFVGSGEARRAFALDAWW